MGATPSKAAMDQFYADEVDISYARMKTARKVVQRIEAILKPKLAELLKERYNITLDPTWKYTGSAYEDLKVCDPDEFDIMLPFDMTHHLTRQSWGLSTLFSLFAGSPQPSSAYRFLPSAREGSPFSEPRGGDRILHSQKVMNGVHSVLQRAVNSVDFGDVTVRIGKDGPAMKVEAKYKDSSYRQQYLKIDLVPAVLDNGTYYVAKPNKYDTSEGAIGKWRVSFSDKEKQKIKDAGEGRRKILKLAKAFYKKDAPLKRLDSYYLKTVFLHMLDKYPGYWTDTGEYFTKFLEMLLAFLRDGNLPMYFMPAHNLIEHFIKDDIRRENIIRRLEGILRKGEDEFIKITQR